MPSAAVSLPFLLLSRLRQHVYKDRDGRVESQTSYLIVILLLIWVGGPCSPVFWFRPSLFWVWLRPPTPFVWSVSYSCLFCNKYWLFWVTLCGGVQCIMVCLRPMLCWGHNSEIWNTSIKAECKPHVSLTRSRQAVEAVWMIFSASYHVVFLTFWAPHYDNV